MNNDINLPLFKDAQVFNVPLEIACFIICNDLWDSQGQKQYLLMLLI